MGFFRKNKFDKLTREDVCDSILKLENEENKLENKMIENKTTVNELLEKGKKETDRQTKIFYAKKINMLEEEKKSLINRSMYLMYNIKLMNKLKAAIDDNKFFENNSGMSLGNLLSDQKGLAKFLNKALDRKIQAEDVLTNADDIFNEVEESYEENDKIYGTQDADDSLLAIFETANGVDDFNKEDVLPNEQSDSIINEK